MSTYLSSIVFSQFEISNFLRKCFNKNRYYIFQFNSNTIYTVNEYPMFPVWKWINLPLSLPLLRVEGTEEISASIMAEKRLCYE